MSGAGGEGAGGRPGVMRGAGGRAAVGVLDSEEVVSFVEAAEAMLVEASAHREGVQVQYIIDIYMYILQSGCRVCKDRYHGP
jgi:hypothetical protein